MSDMWPELKPDDSVTAETSTASDDETLDEVLDTVLAMGLKKAEQYRLGRGANTLMSDTLWKAKQDLIAWRDADRLHQKELWVKEIEQIIGEDEVSNAHPDKLRQSPPWQHNQLRAEQRKRVTQIIKTRGDKDAKI